MTGYCVLLLLLCQSQAHTQSVHKEYVHVCLSVTGH